VSGPDVATRAPAAAPRNRARSSSADATTDSDLVEFPASISLYVDDALVDNQPCDLPLDHSCTQTMSWDATGVTGARPQDGGEPR
jgi:hypothetical protein